jgi:transcriptional regulator with XRE-family HTH domain
MPRRRCAALCKLCGRQDNAVHRAGVYHRQRRKIHAMLGSFDLTTKQIARRLGVSRQRVQQIARERGYSGRLRRLARGLDRHNSLVIPEPANTVAGLATRQGLAWEIIFARRHHDAPKVYARRILIAGRRCVIRKVIGPHPSSPSACWLHFKPGAKSRWAEFVILPFGEDAFEIPRKLYRQTVFVFGREKLSPGRPDTIDWRSFYGAWGQLRV